MPDVPLGEVVCHNCSGRTIQRLSSLEPVIWLQAVSSEDGIYINYACPVCNKLTRSRVGSEAKIWPDVNVMKFPDHLDLFMVFLKCSKTGCESPVILLAPMKNGVRDVDLIARTSMSIGVSMGPHVPRVIRQRIPTKFGFGSR
jgi:hypothetical protein